MPLNKEYITDALALIDSFEISASDEAFEDLARRLANTNSEQKSGYQNAWAEKSKRFELAHEQSNNMADCLATVNGVPASNGIIISAITHGHMTVGNGRFTAKPGHMVVVHDGQYKMAPNSIDDTRLIETIIKACTKETQAIIELGCGWGRNLAGIAMGSPRRDLMFVGMEQSEDGLRCTEKLLAKDSSVRCQTAHFDFYEPDYSALKDYTDIVVFTSAAIEQIAFIGADFIDEIMDIAENVTLIFYEPIGWQRDDNLQKFGLQAALVEIMETIPPEKQHLLNYTFVLDDRALESNAVSWSVCGKYNLNLWSVIQNAVARDVVVQTHAEFNIFGLNPFNPYSLIVLQKRK